MTARDHSIVGRGYAAAAAICRGSGSNFYRSFALLPADQRRAMEVLYAFARCIDDISDQPQPGDAVAQLAAWRLALQPPTEMPADTDVMTPPSLTHAELLPALHDVVDRHSIDVQWLADLISGALWDLQPNKIESTAELNDYCYRVAGTIGLSCLKIWRCPDQHQPAALACGRAFQTTNILRDVREDAERGRVYLPTDVLHEEGLTRMSLLQRSVTAETLRRVILREAERARAEYDDGWSLMEGLQGGGARMFSMMWRTYRGLLEQVARDPWAAYQRRARLPARQRLWLIASHTIFPLFSLQSDPRRPSRPKAPM